MKHFSNLAAAQAAISRRRFLRMGACATLASLASASFANTGHGRGTEGEVGAKSLSFYHTHTSESLKVVYWEEGRYLPESLRELDFLLRDFRTNQVKAITPELFDLLHQIQMGLNTVAPFHIISAYRSPDTNRMLHENSSGVASRSLHMDGLAMDIRVPGRELKQLHQVAMAQRRGGVGYYPASQFVHVDVGRVRHW